MLRRLSALLAAASLVAPLAAQSRLDADIDTKIRQEETYNSFEIIGIPRDHIEGKCRDTFTQVLNTALPGGLLTVDKAVDMLNQGCYPS